MIQARLLAFGDAGVTMRYKDYRRDGADRQRVMTLRADEFIRRFLLHVLPRGFHRIRHDGLLAGSARKASIALVRDSSTSCRMSRMRRSMSRSIQRRYARAAAAR